MNSTESPISGSPQTMLKVGDFRADTSANELLAADGTLQRIEPRLMALLVRLAHSAGSVVPRETLINEVWQRRMVNDEVLSRAIADLRAALGDDPRQPRYIETIPKAGYRLIAPVTNLPAATALPYAASAPHAVSAPHASLLAEEHAAFPSGAITRPPGKWRWPLAGTVVLALAGLVFAVAMREPPRDWEAVLTAALREAQPLTAEVDLEIGPRFSPDGTRLLFTRTDRQTAALMLIDLATRERRRVGAVDAITTQGVFMPDGHHVVYRALRGQSCSIEMAAPGGEPRSIAACDGNVGSRMDLTPDGTTLVVSRNHRDTYPPGLALLRVADGQLTQLTTPSPGDGEDVQPRFSPDGQQIAFIRGNSSARSVWVLPVHSPSAARKVGTLTGLTYGLAWIPNGKALLVSADWFGFRALNWLDIDSGTARLLGARGARAPDLMGSKVAFEHAVYQANLWSVPLDGRAPTVLDPSTRYTSQQVYSPDGTSLVYVSNRDGTESIHVAVQGGVARRLKLPEGFRYLRPRWGADGQSILAVRVAAAAAKSAPQQAVRYDLATDTTAVLPLGDNVASVQESNDGNWWYLGERQERLMRLWRAAKSDPAKLQRLPVPVLSEFLLDGDQLAFTQTGLGGITLCTLDGGTCRQVSVPVGKSHDDHWTLAGNGIYFVDETQRPGQVSRHDLRTGAVTQVTSFRPTTLGAGLAVHPGGQALVVAREEPPNIDLMLGTLAE